MSIAGGVLFAAGLPLAIWNEAEIAANDARIVELNEEYVARTCLGDPDQARCVAIALEGEERNGLRDQQNILRATTIASAVVGALLAGIGIPLWVSAPSSDDVDASARASLRLGPGGLSLSGSF